MKIIIAGGRDLNNYPLVVKTMSEICDKYIPPTYLEEVVFVSGGAKGADALGEAWVSSRMAHPSYKTWKQVVFAADWDKHGKAAGPIRNAEMADYADMCVVFWDGKSKGYSNMIQTALKKGLLVKVVYYGGTA